MKKTKVITLATTLISTLVLGSTVASAAPGATTGSPATRDTDALVQFEVDDSDEPVDPKDPIAPEIPVIPEDPINPGTPVEPGTSGPLSLDYASSFNFGKNKISTYDQTYYAKTQRVTVAGVTTDKPLYVQVTDKRGDLSGWSLNIKQNGQFKTADGHVLDGAVIKMNDGQRATISVSDKPSTINESVILDENGASSLLMKAEKGEGAGTWIYRSGDLNTMTEGVQLDVPGRAVQLKDKNYETTLTWTLSVLPGN